MSGSVSSTTPSRILIVRGRRVQVAGGLVTHDNPGIVDERPRDRRQIIELGVEQGTLRRSLDSALATDVMWVAMHGLTSLAISGRMYGNPNMIAAEEVDRRAHALTDALADSWFADWTAAPPG